VEPRDQRVDIYANAPGKAQSVAGVLDRLDNWRQLAACADAPDADIFFYEPFSRDRNNGAAAARSWSKP
jgi:hypothetical protein